MDLHESSFYDENSIAKALITQNLDCWSNKTPNQKYIHLEITENALGAFGLRRALAACGALLLARSCLVRADLKFFGSPEGTSNALFRSTWPFFRSN